MKSSSVSLEFDPWSEEQVGTGPVVEYWIQTSIISATTHQNEWLVAAIVVHIDSMINTTLIDLEV